MISRRTFLVAGVAGSAALAASWWLQTKRPHRTAAATSTPLPAFGTGALAILGAIVPAVLAGALPQAPAERADALRETKAAVVDAIGALPPAAQHELAQLFALLAFAPARLALARVNEPWTSATPEAIAAFLDRWRDSRWQMQRAAYSALHQLVLAAWYGNPRAWPAIGYPGPPTLAA